MSFAGLEIAKRALSAHQVRISVTAQNIANQATEGYSRQEVQLAAFKGTTLPGGNRWLGGGVTVKSVERQRDSFIDGLVRYESGKKAEWEEVYSGLRRLESIMQEPSGKGISDQLTEFWDAWQQLSTMPESKASRAGLREKAKAVVNQFKSIDSQLATCMDEYTSQIDSTIKEVNGLAERTAALNLKIQRAAASGRSTGVLSDERDLLIDKMADLIGARVNVLEDGTVQVFVGTGALVDGDRTHPLQSDPGGAGLPVSWEETGAAISTSSLGGRIGGLAKLLGTEAPDLRSRISSLAEEVFNAVNTIHTGGTDLDGNPGGDFFTLDGPPPFSINSMQVNPAFDADLDLIAAAQGGGPGDGSNALEISKLATGETPGGVQVMEYHRQTLAELGVATSTAEQMQDNQEVILQDLHRKRDAVSGVSLDEELTNLVEAEHAYQAAARLVKTMDSCLNTIVNELGFAGH